MPRQTVTCILMGVALSTVVLVGQSGKSWPVPRMPDGRPDFQGVWANNGMTPLERPKQFGLRATMTDAELAEIKQRATKMMDGGDAFLPTSSSPPRSTAKRSSAPLIPRLATTTRHGYPIVYGTTAPRSSSIHPTAGFRR